jgi:transcriptional regulator with XRE-family HTH domain
MTDGARPEEGRREGEVEGRPEGRLEGIGRALRLLRLRRGRKQFEVAAAAEITKAMLSAYETGKRQPSLKTLGCLLDALDADLADLHRALVVGDAEDSLLHREPEEDRPYPIGERGGGLGGAGGGEIAEPVDVRGVLGLSGPLPPSEEEALTEMLEGFHRLLRYFHFEWRRRRAAG